MSPRQRPAARVADSAPESTTDHQRLTELATAPSGTRRGAAAGTGSDAPSKPAPKKSRQSSTHPTTPRKENPSMSSTNGRSTATAPKPASAPSLLDEVSSLLAILENQQTNIFVADTDLTLV